MYRLSTDVVDLGDHLLNTKTGDLIEVDKSGRAALQSVQSGVVDEAVPEIAFMIENGILVNPALNPDLDTFYLQWHLTDECNLTCTHCYRFKKNIAELTFEEMTHVVDNYIEFLKKMEMNSEITLTGGETLLFPKLPELIEYIKTRDVFINLTLLTNGTIPLDDTWIALFKKYKMRVQISFDGTEPIHDAIRGSGSYAKSLVSSKRLIKENIPHTVHYVIMKKNVAHIEEFVYSVKEIGIKQVNFTRLVPIGTGAAEASLDAGEFLTTIRHIARLEKKTNMRLVARRPVWNLVGGRGGFCPIGYNFITVDVNGDFLPCRRLPIVLGNAKRDTFFKVWFTSEFLEQMRDRENNLPVCGTCSKAEVCGGCRAISQALTGDVFAPDPHCPLAIKKRKEVM